MELSIDTATDWASLALSRQGKVVAELTWHAGQGHLVQLFPNLSHLLAQAGAKPGDLQAINVTLGPGGYNSLRVGVAAAKGLALALDIPVAGVSTLEVEAFPHVLSPYPICPLLEAGQGKVAAALFLGMEGLLRRLQEDQLLTLDEACRWAEVPTLFCGQVSGEIGRILKERLGQRAVVAQGAGLLRRAGYLAELGRRRHQEGLAQDDPASLQPHYLRLPAITQRQRP